MSKTWLRRPSRRARGHGKEKHVEYHQRACCPTNRKQPHTLACQRFPRACGTKAAYEGRRQAMAGIRAVTEEGFEPGAIWRAYRCPSCELWHLTTTEERT